MGRIVLMPALSVTPFNKVHTGLTDIRIVLVFIIVG